MIVSRFSFSLSPPLSLQVNYRQAVLFHCGHTLSVPVYYNVHHHPACSWDALQMLSKGIIHAHVLSLSPL